MEKRMSKMLAIIFALALAFAYSCGGSDGSGGGGAASYTPDNAPPSSDHSSLTTVEKTEVEQVFSAFIQIMGNLWGGATSKSASVIYDNCDTPFDINGCSNAKMCIKAEGSATSGSFKIYIDQAVNCTGVTLYILEFDAKYSKGTVTDGAGAIDIEWAEQFNVQNFRVFVKWDKNGAVEGWIAEDGLQTATIGGTTTTPTITWL